MSILLAVTAEHLRIYRLSIWCVRNQSGHINMISNPDAQLTRREATDALNAAGFRISPSTAGTVCPHWRRAAVSPVQPQVRVSLWRSHRLGAGPHATAGQRDAQAGTSRGLKRGAPPACETGGAQFACRLTVISGVHCVADPPLRINGRRVGEQSFDASRFSGTRPCAEPICTSARKRKSSARPSSSSPSATCRGRKLLSWQVAALQQEGAQ